MDGWSFSFPQILDFFFHRGWSGAAMVLGKLSVPGRPTIWITVGQGPTALAVGVGWGCSDSLTLIYSFSPLSPSLWETARYRLKLSQRAVKPKTTNQPSSSIGGASLKRQKITARGYKNAGSDQLITKLFLLINVKIPIIVGKVNIV